MGVYKTHEQYVKELAEKNPNIEVIGKYKGSNEKIAHRCLIHNIIWDILPYNALKGQGCSQCRYEKMQKAKYKSHEEYIEELKLINPNIIPLEKYVMAKTPIKHKCLIHNYEWNAEPTNILQGKGCPICGREKISNKLGMTHDQYCEKLNDVNSNIIPLEQYINMSTPILHLCKTHNIKWKVLPLNILKGMGCEKCKIEKISISNSLTHEEYCNMLKKENPFIIPLEKYINCKTQIKHKCLIHNVVWLTTPDVILQGCGCPTCKSEKISEKATKSNEQYLNEINILKRDVIPLEKYKGSNTAILHKCLICNHEWNITPGNVLYGFGCPICNLSHGEKAIKQYLEDNNIMFTPQKRFDDCRDINPLPFDFYLDESNKCIEFDGKQHFEPIDYFGGEKSFKVLQIHDNIKNEYCKNNNIPLLRIPYNATNLAEQLDNFIFN